MATKYVREIITGIEPSTPNKEILESVLQWLSRDRYSGSRWNGIEKAGVAIEETPLEMTICVRPQLYLYTGTNEYNRFLNMTDEQILLFFAQRVRAMTIRDLRDDYEADVLRRMIDSTNISATEIPAERLWGVIDGGEKYLRYLEEHPFTSRESFTERNLKTCPALWYHSVSDGVKVFNALVAQANRVKGEK